MRLSDHAEATEMARDVSQSIPGAAPNRSSNHPANHPSGGSPEPTELIATIAIQNTTAASAVVIVTCRVVIWCCRMAEAQSARNSGATMIQTWHRYYVVSDIRKVGHHGVRQAEIHGAEPDAPHSVAS